MSGLASVFADGHVDGCELAGYHAGLSAGLGKALVDLDDTELVAAARGGFAAVPAERVHEDATVVEHGMVAAEGVAILDVRLPAGLTVLRPAGDRPEVVGLRLAAVRIGLVRKVLDQALARQTDENSLLRWRIGLRAIGEIRAVLEGLRWRLVGLAGFPSRADVAEVHARLTDLDWRVARLFWPEGYREDRRVRALFVGELVATTWVGA
ncbi:hypothetical protein [Actinophytocola oryzae]|uniref:Uncharacterized protein n=1 Tax=Actinophytocola oryzae TaxID=502181 RepID=A0A4R7V2L9_9PSEU|nr:hypothetical protein [Actinophytocola oryzae]TDV43608.1 hypothetical protein CLV71_11570 [Actinophytocola oryzae]